MTDTLSPERVAEIRALAEKATPGPWEVDDEQNDGNFGGGPDCNSGYKSYAVITGNKTVVDTLNSDLAEIEEDGDCEDGSWRYSRWDEVGRRNAAYIAALDPQTVLALLAPHEALRAEVERLGASARRWDALINCAHMAMRGWAGFGLNDGTPPDSSGHRHMEMAFWSLPVYSGDDDNPEHTTLRANTAAARERAQKVLTAFADACAELGTARDALPLPSETKETV